MIPKPHYSLINTSRGNDPAVVVVNSSLCNFKERPAFPWHLKISIDCKFVGNNGMPTNDEIQALNRVEDDISSALQRDENALFLARITCRATRELLYRIHDPKVANESLQQLISADSQLREWEYQMEKDESWQLAEPELSLLRKARLN